MSTGWLNFIKDVFHVTKFCFSSSASESVQNHWQSPQMLTLVFTDVVLPISLSIDYPHSTDKEDSPMSHSWSMAQPGACHGGLPDPQNLSPHRLKTVSFKTDTALACLFPSFIFKLYKTFKSEPQNDIKEHYTRRHLPNRNLQSINLAPFVFYL